jgi:hypothetical protein
MQAWVDLTPRNSPEGTAENIPGCNPGLQHSLVVCSHADSEGPATKTFYSQY